MLHFDHTRPCHVSPSLDTLFHLPLSELAFQQLTQLAQDIQDAVFSEEHDVLMCGHSYGVPSIFQSQESIGIC